MRKFQVQAILQDDHGNWRVRASNLPETKDFVYEHADYMFRGEADDFVDFFAYSGPSSGFGGHSFVLNMRDGSQRTLIGPWSGREGLLHQLFLNHPPVVEVLDDDRVVRYVPITVIERLGLTATPVTRFDDEVYYEISS